jgi:uncharacterized protein YdhG (YjbR/CyaY superfamily)
MGPGHSKQRSLLPVATGISAMGSGCAPGPCTLSCSAPNRYAHAPLTARSYRTHRESYAAGSAPRPAHVKITEGRPLAGLGDEREGVLVERVLGGGVARGHRCLSEPAALDVGAGANGRGGGEARAGGVSRRNDASYNAVVSAEEIDDYLQRVEEPKRRTLAALRGTILEVIPDAEQGISYGMPAFRLRGKTIAGFAAFKDHLSYLPHSGSVLGQLADDLSGYTMTKGSLHFPVDQPLPKAVVKRLIAVRLREVDHRPH